MIVPSERCEFLLGDCREVLKGLEAALDGLFCPESEIDWRKVALCWMAGVGQKFETLFFKEWEGFGIPKRWHHTIYCALGEHWKARKEEKESEGGP